VQLGANFTLSLQIANTGPSAATFSGIAATGDYTAANGTCPLPGLTLAPAASCTAQVTFTPTQTGARTGTLSITTSATTLPLTAALTGIGAQSHLQVSPAGLGFGTIAVGATASLSLTLANTGTAPIVAISLATTGDYAVTVPCAVTTLAAGGSCSVTVTFTPTAAGARPGTLTVTSSDPSSPYALPLTGTGAIYGSFTLSANGAATASATVTSGTPAAFDLTLTPSNGFSGTVVLNCTPVVAAQYAFCSLLPSSVTLGAAAQNAVATLNTVTSISANSPPPSRSFDGTAVCLLFPALILTWKARTSRHRAWRRFGPMAWVFLSTVALLSSSGCGGGGTTTVNANPNLRYASPGVYQYQVSASSVGGAVQITQTVTLNLTVQ
jgi:hypothetical protein